ncbi:MAG: DUF695 domain-containing protein [Clostridiaceae bacterium]|nr:DUF695 domain-containing protein [Eubacteriales bacterium]
MSQSADRFTYDWQIDGDDAVFSADLSLYERAPDPNNSVLLYMNCAAKAAGKPLDDKLERRAEGVLKKCLKALPLLCAGFIRTSDAKQFYFYAHAPEGLNTLEAIAQKERGLYCRAGMQLEPEWQTYLRLLYPDAAKLQTEQNRHHLALLKKHGDNAAAARRIRFHVFFPSEPIVKYFGEEARRIGFAVGDQEFASELENPYGVALHKISALDKKSIDRLTTEIIRLAEGYEGMLRDWDCQLMPKKPVF